LLFAAELERLDVPPSPHVPDVDRAAILAGEQQLGFTPFFTMFGVPHVLVIIVS
jgi:hypothetical protein